MPGIMVAKAFGRTNPCCIVCHRIDLMLMRRRPPEPGAVVMNIVEVPPEPEELPMIHMAEAHRFQRPEATQKAAMGTTAPAVYPPEAIPMPAMAIPMPAMATARAFHTGSTAPAVDPPETIPMPAPETIPMPAMAKAHAFNPPQAAQMAAQGTRAPALDPRLARRLISSQRARARGPYPTRPPPPVPMPIPRFHRRAEGELPIPEPDVLVDFSCLAHVDF